MECYFCNQSHDWADLNSRAFDSGKVNCCTPCSLTLTTIEGIAKSYGFESLDAVARALQTQKDFQVNSQDKRIMELRKELMVKGEQLRQKDRTIQQLREERDGYEADQQAANQEMAALRSKLEAADADQETMADEIIQLKADRDNIAEKLEAEYALNKALNADRAGASYDIKTLQDRVHKIEQLLIEIHQLSSE